MVKCSDCGYLAMRVEASREIVEADEPVRKDGKPQTSLGLYPYPLCFETKIDVEQETKNLPDSISGRDKQVLEILNIERVCDRFIAYQLGFSPRERYDMQMLEEQRKFQEERLDADRQFRKQQDGDTRDWQARQSAKTFTKQVIIFGVIVTLALIVSQIFAAFVPIIWETK